MPKRHAFTLVEMLVTVALTGIILTAAYAAFQGVMRSQSRLGATIDVQRSLFYLNEKIAHLIRTGGTIDYEEYFNRRILGYTQDNTTTPGIFTFNKVSNFGNGPTSPNPATRPDIYFCGVDSSTSPHEQCLDPSSGAVFKSTTTVDGTTTVDATLPTGQQPYGQYRALALDHLRKNGGTWIGYPYPIPLPSIFKADEKVGVYDFTNKNVADKNASDVGLPELYLIKKEIDGSYTRTYFRHVYVVDETAAAGTSCALATSLANCRGKIQITKLVSCDSLPQVGGSSAPDGIIDAWIPDADFSKSAIKKCTDISSVDKIHDAADNLVWRDLTSPDLNVIRATWLPTPTKIHDLMIEGGAVSPRVTMRLDITLSERMRRRAAIAPAENSPRILMTTYDLAE